MNRLFRLTMMVLALVAGFAGAANAAESSPVGVWASSSGESHYEFSFCGDGTQLCAKLVYLRKDALNSKTKPYLNTYLVQNAKRTAANVWKGDVHLFDQTAGGKFTLVSNKKMTLEGCYLIFCKSYDLLRVK